jgi:hypothetical protein
MFLGLRRRGLTLVPGSLTIQAMGACAAVNRVEVLFRFPGSEARNRAILEARGRGEPTPSLSIHSPPFLDLVSGDANRMIRDPPLDVEDQRPLVSYEPPSSRTPSVWDDDLNVRGYWARPIHSPVLSGARRPAHRYDARGQTPPSQALRSSANCAASGGRPIPNESPHTNRGEPSPSRFCEAIGLANVFPATMHLSPA